MTKPLDLNEERDKRKPHFNFFALCLACKHRWIATVMAETSIFKLECPQCGEFDSFGSIIPIDYVMATQGFDE